LIAPLKLRALVLCGPTSSGKSAIALGVASRLGGEIVNADSRQIYAGMRIGTGMPGPDALTAVPHHLYAFVAPEARYSAARFASDARNAIAQICQRGKLPIVVGGTGFYVEALCGTMKLDRPPPDDEWRARLRREQRVHPAAVLWEWLHARDPRRAATVRPSDAYRVLRALEATVVRAGAGATDQDRASAIDSLIVRLSVTRAELRHRIGARVRAMFAEGLAEEARTVRQHAPEAPALTGLGYAESLAWWDGCATLDEAIAKTIARTMQYAKRQETWFRHMHDAVVVEGTVRDDAIARIAALARERFTAA
jgi:tRNA dimethylallyltransferase